MLSVNILFLVIFFCLNRGNLLYLGRNDYHRTANFWRFQSDSRSNPEQRLPSQFSEIIYIMNERGGIHLSGSAGLLSGIQYLCLGYPSGHTFLWYHSYSQIRLVQMCYIQKYIWKISENYNLSWMRVQKSWEDYIMPSCKSYNSCQFVSSDKSKYWW